MAERSRSFFVLQDQFEQFLAGGPVDHHDAVHVVQRGQYCTVDDLS